MNCNLPLITVKAVFFPNTRFLITESGKKLNVVGYGFIPKETHYNFYMIRYNEDCDGYDVLQRYNLENEPELNYQKLISKCK